MNLHPLPRRIQELLSQSNAPARLVAHLRLVHDVAIRLCQRLKEKLPELAFDQEAVLIGAATHDIGKTVFPTELQGSGKDHEIAGRDLLLSAGFPEKHARFAYTHGGPAREPNPSIEDLLVRSADAIWRGARNRNSEDKLIEFICADSKKEKWQVYLLVDEILTELALDADKRLSYQESASAADSYD